MQQNSNNIRDIPNELFLANAVHEIRTPVQTIIGTLDLLSDTQMNTEQTEYVRQIRFGAEVLLALVNDILDFSKIKSHKMLLENVPYDIKDLVENVVYLTLKKHDMATVQTLMKKKGIMKIIIIVISMVYIFIVQSIQKLNLKPFIVIMELNCFVKNVENQYR